MTKKQTLSFLLLAFVLMLQTTGAQQQQKQKQKQKQQQQFAAPTSRVINAAQLLLDLKTLAADEMQGRGVGAPGGLKARQYVAERFKKSGLKPFGASFFQPFEFENRTGVKREAANVVGFIKGKQNPEKYIVVTAHYDHVGVIDNQIYNGADDNASGTAALFALAEYFNKKRPANSIIFAALDAEESGLRGARKFVAEPPVKKESILLNVNMDMISRNEAGELYAAGTYHYPFLKKYLEDAAKTAPIKLRLGHDRPEQGQDDWTNQSDHGAFHQAKIPFIYFGVEDHKDYHRPTDDFENIDQKFYVGAVETILDALKKFDAGLAQVEKRAG
jgi:hypothetical protein